LIVRPAAPDPAGVAAAKRALRLRLAARAPEPDAAAKDARIHAHLLGEDAFLGAQRVALYAALPGEIATRPLFDVLIGAGKTCLLPRMTGERRLEFTRVEAWEDLVPGRLGVLEAPAAVPALPLREGDLVLVPGVAFDADGRRLGRGGGYYDRSFPPAAAAGQPLLVGVTYESRLVDSLPTDSHDRAMGAIVTERAFRWTRGDRG